MELNKVETINLEVESQSNRLATISNIILKKYLGDLDDFMQIVSNDVKLASEQNIELSTTIIDRYILQLSPRLYWAVEGVEKLGLQEDISEEIRKTIYNQAREESSGTVQDKNTKAEEKSKEETLIKNMYTYCYKTAKGKVEYGFELLKSLKKILSKRMLEMQMSLTSNGVSDGYMENIGTEFE